MKYSMSSRQPKIHLSQADEILVEGRDYRQISDLFIEYPDKMIILQIENEKLNEPDYMKIVEEYGKSSENFCCCIYNLKEINWFKERKIKFYYGYPISTYYDMQGLMNIGVEYIKIVAPLTFDMDTLSSLDIKFRMVPNVAYDAYIPRENGICGQWVRPEDVQWYEDGIYIFDFEDANLDKEKTLYHIYAKEKCWNGNLNLLLTNLNINADNRGLPEEIGETRSICRQRCMQNGTCHFCETAFKFEESIRKLKRENELKERY